MKKLIFQASLQSLSLIYMFQTLDPKVAQVVKIFVKSLKLYRVKGKQRRSICFTIVLNTNGN